MPPLCLSLEAARSPFAFGSASERSGVQAARHSLLCPAAGAWLSRTHLPGAARRKQGFARVHCSAAGVAGQKMEAVEFNDGRGVRFAPILNGMWALAGGHGRLEKSDILESMEAHAKAGFTTFDTADIYGPSESVLGEFRERWAAERGGADAAGVQVFTKYVPNIFRIQPTPEVVEGAIRKSLAALRTPKLDLVQLHWWDYEFPGMVEVAQTLGRLQEEGLIRSIATTNMNTEALSRLLDAGLPIVANQVQFSLLDRRPLKQMMAFCKERNIKLLTYGTLAGGLLSDRYFGEGKKGLLGHVSYPTVDLNTSSLKMYWPNVAAFGGQDLWRELLDVLHQVSQKHSVSIANVALRWAMDQGPVHPIVGMRNRSHIEDNLRTLALRLDESDRAMINGVLKKGQDKPGDCFDLERSR